MAIRTKAEILSLIGGNVPDEVDDRITPQFVRDVLRDIVDSATFTSEEQSLAQYHRPNPVAILWGTGQTEELGPGLIDRSIFRSPVTGAGYTQPNQRFAFIDTPQRSFYGGENLGIRVLSGEDIPADADRFGLEGRPGGSVPDGCIIEVPAGIWGIFSKFHLAVSADTRHHMEFRRVMIGLDDVEFIDSTGYSQAAFGSTTELHKEIFKTTQTEYYYVTATHVDSDDEADASYYMGFIRYPDELGDSLI